MPTTPQRASTPSAGDDRNLVQVDENYLAPSFEDRLRLFWAKNSRVLLAASALVLAIALIKGGYEIYTARQEKAAAADYAAAGDDTQKLKSFAGSHEGHVLVGLAQLKLADAAYVAGHYADARSAYEKAFGALKHNNTFGPRARLGAAISALQAGATADGEAALKAIVADSHAGKITRSEAAYQLATLAAAEGDAAEAIRLIEQATVLEPDGQWADRASQLRASLPTAAIPASTPATATDAKATEPAVSFK